MPQRSCGLSGKQPITLLIPLPMRECQWSANLMVMDTMQAGTADLMEKAKESPGGPRSTATREGLMKAHASQRD